MKTTEMKDVLFNKLQDENCYFKKSDISIKSSSKGIKIVIKGYEHYPFTLTTEEDDYFGFIVNVYDGFEERVIIFEDSKKGYNYPTALIRLGYYIASRF